MDDAPPTSPWVIADGLRPAPVRAELSVAAKLEAAHAALLFAEDALAHGVVKDGRRVRGVKERDEIVLLVIRNALGLICGEGLS